MTRYDTRAGQFRFTWTKLRANARSSGCNCRRAHTEVRCSTQRSLRPSRFATPSCCERFRHAAYDFSIYYDWAVAVRRGLDPYTADLYGQGLSLGLEVPNRQAVYPPPALAVFGLLGYLPIHAAYWIWIALGAIAFALLLGRFRLGGAAPAIVALILLSPHR